MWCVASITIFYKGVKDIAANYGPISLKFIACKEKETIVHNTMNDNKFIKRSEAWFYK